MISQTSEYALRAMVLLAECRGEPLTSQQIASTAQMPAGYMSKVLQSLARAGLIHSRRGLYGGFTLARESRAITVLDVVGAVEPSRRSHSCPVEGTTDEPHFCALSRCLDDAIDRVEQLFASTCIASLAEESAPEPALPQSPVEGRNP